MNFDIPNVAFTAEEWIARASNPWNKGDAFTRLVHVQDGIAFATNRRRMHWGKTVFPDGTYDPASFTPTEFHGNHIPVFSEHLPDWAEFTDTRIGEIKNASPGPEGEDVVHIVDEMYINKTWLLEAMNGNPFRLMIGPNRVAGVGSFGHFMIAQIKV
ncbi:MAG: hypothetical protein IIB38_07345 [Candidatus Hydrogenedentes bacterium]|nr:hypothetical protein [Candidatus Hydrogenedentota bacterium]